MDEIAANKTIKLGTGVRYLIEVQPGEQLGNGRVLDNIQAVLNLTKELGFTTTAASGAYTKLDRLFGELRQATAVSTTIDEPQANRLEAIARKLRQSLLTEGSDKTFYVLTEKEAESVGASGWPTEITLDLLRKTPWQLASWFIGLLIASFSLGIWFAHTNLYHELAALFETRTGTPSEPVDPAGEPDASVEP